MSSVLLMCAVLASLAFGVLAAYAICVGMFKVFKLHSVQAAQARAALKDAQAAMVAVTITPASN